MKTSISLLVFLHFFFCRQVSGLKCYVNDVEGVPHSLLGCQGPELETAGEAFSLFEDQLACYKVTPQEYKKFVVFFFSEKFFLMRGCIPKGTCWKVEDLLKGSLFARTTKVKCTECFTDGCNGATARQHYSTLFAVICFWFLPLLK